MAMERAGGEAAAGARESAAPDAASSVGKQSLAERDETSESRETDEPKTVGRGGGGGRGRGPATFADHGGVRVENFNGEAPIGPAGRTKVGVGEVVTFSVAGRGGTWSADRSFKFEQGVASGRSTAEWRAPETPGAATITHTPANGGAAKTVAMQVVAPTTVQFVSKTEEAVGRAGAQMKCDLGFDPPDVSYAGVSWKEDAGAAAQPQGMTGYFDRYKRQGGDLQHYPNKDWTQMVQRPTGGARVNDTAGISGLPPIDNGLWSEGYFFWEIPNRYRIEDGGGAGQQIAKTKQEFWIKRDGEVTVKKGAQSVTARPGDIARARTTAEGDAYRADHAHESLELLVQRLREAPDAATKDAIRPLLASRIADEAKKPLAKLTLKCNSKYSWSFLNDSAKLKIGTQEIGGDPLSLEAGETHTKTVELFQFFPLATLESGTGPLATTVQAEIETRTHVIDIPRIFETHDFRPLDGQGKYELRWETVHTGPTGLSAKAIDAGRAELASPTPAWRP